MDGFERLHPSALRIIEVLEERGVVGPFRQFDVSTKTAADAAAALDCEVGAIASTLIFVIDGETVVVLKSGAHRVDTEKLRQLTGASAIRQATADEVREATGQSIGGVSPVGWPRPLRTFIDESLAQFQCLWAACGTPNAVFRTTYEELSEISGASPVRL
jgi:prolyl-tRNA editing enzyme YbaK/EbsC (Cys-tRNA(Pro) deacylase)